MLRLYNPYPTLNYIGNKEKLADWICSFIPEDATSFFDAFSGGCSVSYAAKNRGYSVISNDILNINYQISKAIIENSSEILTYEDLQIILQGVPIKGFMTQYYSNVLYYESECMEVDQYVANIRKLSSAYKQALAYCLLRRAMIRKMPYSRFNIDWKQIEQLRDEEYSYEKYKRRRGYHNETFKQHIVSASSEMNRAVFDNSRSCKAMNEDIFSIVGKVKADVIYLDPPYSGTMNDYFSFYGVLDEIIMNGKRDPFENNFVTKTKVIELFDRLFSKLSEYKYCLLSYNNRSYPSKEQMFELLSRYAKKIDIHERIHNYQITGKTMKKENKEILFVITNK